MAGPPLAAQQAQPSIKPVASVPAAEPAPDVLTIGERTDRMTVPVTIGPHGPFPFIIDTGAERSVVSRELASYLKLLPGTDVKLFDFTGAAQVATVKVPSLTAGKLGTPAMEAPQLLLADIGAPGMLGIDALQGQKVVLDFGARRMLLRPGRRHASGDFVIRAQSRTGQLIVTKAWFNNQPIAVIIDTGSWLSVGNTAMLKLAKKTPRSYGPVAITSVTGRTFTANFVSISNVKIDTIRFDNFGLVFADVPPFDRFGLRDQPALILGMSSLKLFGRVELDFVNREIGFSLPRPQIDFHDICRNGSAACRTIGPSS
ncbi:retroviral-like aspartic protease family protein [Sphingomonas asaccharolytica]|uniref:retroviral-like aspartic protease family protein n=1 Tax=Sphingomonas asaccharolytica TaxID=40681 RepID=UPI001C3F7416|nr:retroviral-like aspartic protease family protein [Sphingomonas asaccharolytica]